MLTRCKCSKCREQRHTMKLALFFALGLVLLWLVGCASDPSAHRTDLQPAAAGVASARVSVSRSADVLQTVMAARPDTDPRVGEEVIKLRGAADRLIVLETDTIPALQKDVDYHAAKHAEAIALLWKTRYLVLKSWGWVVISFVAGLIFGFLAMMIAKIRGFVKQIPVIGNFVP